MQTCQFMFAVIKIPPFLVFTKGSKGRDVVFRGLALAVPGIEGDVEDDLVAIWRSKHRQRFQNYRAKFTILDAGILSRQWLNALRAGYPLHSSAPKAWRNSVEHGIYAALKAPPTRDHRTKEEQLPSTGRDRALVQAVYEYFKDDCYHFEHCAARLAGMMDRNIIVTAITRRVVDGGRDAIGIYRVGPEADPIELDFSLEAKCYAPTTSVNVEDLSRLISRLRHRQFGILVTTSYLAWRAYQELRSDGHPVVVIAGNDIAAILVMAGLGTPDAVRRWLSDQFPMADKDTLTP